MSEHHELPFLHRVLQSFNPHIDGRRTRPWAGFAAQVLLVTVAALLYFGVRMVTKGNEDLAFRNAEALLRLERRLGVQIEDWAQDLILDNPALVTFFNWVYIWLHWPVIIGSLAWLYRFDKRGYVLFRNALFVSGALGLVLFVSFPVAPPRFLDGFSDTVSNLSTSYRYLQPPSIVNKYAAMPSLHVGWNVLAGVVLFSVLRHGFLRYLPLVSPVLMVMAVVFTANHYLIDAVVGSAVAMVGLYGGKLLTDWTEHLGVDHGLPPEAGPVGTASSD